MELDNSGISSLEFESEVEAEDRIYEISQEISSITEISYEKVDKDEAIVNCSQNNLSALRNSLNTNVNILQQELKNLAYSTRNQASSDKEISNTIEILEQISNIKASVDNMKSKLKFSQDLVQEKVEENERLITQLHELEQKSYAQTSHCVSCKNCSLF